MLMMMFQVEGGHLPMAAPVTRGAVSVLCLMSAALAGTYPFQGCIACRPPVCTGVVASAACLDSHVLLGRLLLLKALSCYFKTHACHKAAAWFLITAGFCARIRRQQSVVAPIAANKQQLPERASHQCKPSKRPLAQLALPHETTSALMECNH